MEKAVIAVTLGNCSVQSEISQRSRIWCPLEGMEGGAGGGKGESLFKADVLVRIAACFPFCLSRRRSEPRQWY